MSAGKSGLRGRRRGGAGAQVSQVQREKTRPPGGRAEGLAEENHEVKSKTAGPGQNHDISRKVTCSLTLQITFS